MKETNIDLVDLVRRILLRWKAIVIWMIIFAVLMDGFYYVRALRSVSRTEDTVVSEEEKADAIAEYEQALSEREITDVQNASRAYAQMYRTYQDTLAYCENSIRMQLNANSVSSVTLLYYIEQDTSVSEAKNATNAIIDSLLVIAKGEDVCEQIRDALGWDVDTSYINELITTYAGTDSDIDTGEETETDDTLVRQNRTLKITIYAPDKESATTMAEILRDTFNWETSEIQNALGEFHMVLLQNQYAQRADEYLLADQQDNYSSLNTLRTEMNNLTSGMTDDQKEYYSALLSGVTAEQIVEEADMAEAEEETSTTVSSQANPKLFSGRYIALGLLIGLVLVIICVAIGYVCGRKLRVKEDVEELYHVPLLGFLDVAGAKGLLNGPVCRGINKLFYRRDAKFSAEERMSMICAGIRLAAEKAGMQSVYLTGSAGDAESEQLMEWLTEQLKDSVESISCGRSIVYDPESMEKMTGSDGVVFIERVNISTYADMERETELCSTYEVPVIGGIVIR